MTSSDCDIEDNKGQNVIACMQDLHEQRPSLRSYRHFKDVAGIVGRATSNVAGIRFPYTANSEWHDFKGPRYAQKYLASVDVTRNN